MICLPYHEKPDEIGALNTYSTKHASSLKELFFLQSPNKLVEKLNLNLKIEKNTRKAQGK